MNKPRKPVLGMRSVRVLDSNNQEWEYVEGDGVANGRRMVKSLADILDELGNPHPSQVYLVNDLNYNWSWYDDDEDEGEFGDYADMVRYNQYLEAQRAKSQRKKVVSAEKKIAKLRAQLEAAQAELNGGQANE